MFPSQTSKDCVTSKTFQIIYKNEEIVLEDVFTFRVSLCLDTADFLKQFQKITFQLTAELMFNEKDYVVDANTGFEWVSFRNLLLHFDLHRGLHYHLPVMFDYFHLSAVTLTIHGSLVTICQPYINSNKNDSTMWLTNYLKSEYKGDKRNAGRNANGESELKKVNLNQLQIQRLETTQWQLLSIIISAFLTLKRKMHEYYGILPPWQQAKIKFDSMFAEVSLDNLTELTKECFAKIDSVENFLNLSEALEEFKKAYFKNNSHTANGNEKLKADELANSIGHDLAYLSGLTIDQWNRFALLVGNSDRINQHLSKIHHLQRIKRFSEGFFCIEQPRPNLFGVCDANSSVFLETTEMIRKSAYFNLLPPCDVECVPVDGVSSNLPIIYEEKYESGSSETQQSSVQHIAARVCKSDDFHMSKCSTPTKHSSPSSSSSSPSSISSKANLKALFAKINYRNDKIKKAASVDENATPDHNNQLESVPGSQLTSNQTFNFYKNELFNSSSFDNKMKIFNLISSKEVIANYSKELSDKPIKLLSKDNQAKLKNLLKGTISLDQPAGSLFDLGRPETRRSWPNLLQLDHLLEPSSGELTNDDVQYRSDSVLDEESDQPPPQQQQQQVTCKRKTSKSKYARKSRQPIDPKSLLVSAYKNFPGTMYFPKPPKEFIIDEPAEEVNLKPIPVAIEVTDCHETKSSITTTTTLEDIQLNDLAIDLEEKSIISSSPQPIKSSVSCQNLLESVEHRKTSDTSLLGPMRGTNLSYQKSNSFNETKLTFVELLRSDHCLICCGSIKDRLDGSWPCMCKKKENGKKATSLSADTSPPTLRRVSTVGSDLIAFLHAKEDVRVQVSHKMKNMLFYSDFHNLASRIPYFQCEPDFRSLKYVTTLLLCCCCCC